MIRNFTTRSARVHTSKERERERQQERRDLRRSFRRVVKKPRNERSFAHNIVHDIVVVFVFVVAAAVPVVVTAVPRVMTILLLSIVPGGRRCISLFTPAPFPFASLFHSPPRPVFLPFPSLTRSLSCRVLALCLQCSSCKGDTGGAPRRNLSGRVP